MTEIDYYVTFSILCRYFSERILFLRNAKIAFSGFCHGVNEVHILMGCVAVLTDIQGHPIGTCNVSLNSPKCNMTFWETQF
jgi:hypothetical protein